MMASHCAAVTAVKSNCAASRAPSGKKSSKPNTPIHVALASGETFFESILPKMLNSASPMTAPKISRFPANGREPRAACGDAPNTLTSMMPQTVNAIPSHVRRSARSFSQIAEITPNAAGVVLVMIPPSAALVRRKPYSKKTENRNTPQNA